MALNRRNPIWPYLLVLACLFALSIAAPRGWQHAGQESQSDELGQSQPLRATQSQPTAEIVRPTNIVEAGPAFDERPDRDTSIAETKPQFEDWGEKIAENHRFDSAAELTVKPDHPQTLERTLTPPTETWPAMSPSGARSDGAEEAGLPGAKTLPADEWDTPPPTAPRFDGPALDSVPAPMPATPAPMETVAAPTEPAIAPLDPVVAPMEPVVAAPTEPVAPPVDVASTRPIETPELSLPVQLPPPVPSLPPPMPSEPPLPMTTPTPALPPVEAMTPVEPVEAAAKPQAEVVPAAPPSEPVVQPAPPAPRLISGWPLPENLLARLDQLSQREPCRFWADRVRGQIEQLHQLGPQDCEPALKIIAQLQKLVKEAEAIVPRLPDYSAKAELRRTQYAIVRRLDIWEQVGIIRRRTASIAAAEGTEGLLARIERYEDDGRTSDAHHLAVINGELQSSPEPDEQELARRLNVHYRNANLRVAVAAALVDRMLPEQKPATDAVIDSILGNPVSGNSTTATRLSIQLIPDSQKWQFNLVAAGTVDSHTYTTHGPVTFVNRSAATFQVRKRVVVDGDGVKVTPAVADADNSSELEGLCTSFDSVPIIRGLVRNYARSQAEQNQFAANREAKRKVAAKASQQVDLQSDPRLAQVEENFNHDWIGPLQKLALDPAALSMATTDKRLVLRSRLAGGDQLGANTPRPEAPADSLASTQVHESTLNNLLDHLDLAGRKFTLPELHHWLADKLNRTEAKLPEDLPTGVQITFAANDPIRVRCEDDHLELILSIAEIRDGRRRWHDFEVRATYRPVASGLMAQFERDGTIELGGQYKGKPEVALRGIFSKVLSRERKLNLLPDRVAKDPRLAGLEVTQLVVEDGWIGTAIGPVRTAARPPATKNR